MHAASDPGSLAVPARLDWLRGSDAGREWLADLPRVVADCADQWDLRLGEPFPDVYVSFALPARRPVGSEAVLKIQFPHRESEDEAAALRHWDGEGAIRLLEHDPARHALLVERCVPGTPLSGIEPAAALEVMVGLLPRLWRPAGEPFRSLAEEAAGWASGLVEQWERAGRPFERRLVDAVLDALAMLPSSQGEQVLLHQDLHGENVLRAAREPWLAIDPKPLAGEREFSVAPIVRSFELGHGRAQVARRLDTLTGELGLDRERARLWTLAQTIAWSMGSDYAREHLETAGWLLSMARR